MKTRTLLLCFLLSAFCVSAVAQLLLKKQSIGSLNQSGGPDSLTNGLLARWKFDENGGSVANDSSGNGNTGYLSNSVVWISTGGFRANNSGYFDCGTPSTLMATQSFTVTVWVWLTNANNGQIISWNSTNTKPTISAAQSSSFRPIAYYEANTFRYFSATNPTVTTNNMWHFYAFLMTNQVATTTGLLVDNVPQVVETTTGTSDESVRNRFRIGFGSGGSLIGSMRDLRVWNRILTSNELTKAFSQ